MKTYTQEEVDKLLFDLKDRTINDYKKSDLFNMDICRAYNAGKQNMIDIHTNGNDSFVSSDTYFDKEFPQRKEYYESLLETK